MRSSVDYARIHWNPGASDRTLVLEKTGSDKRKDGCPGEGITYQYLDWMTARLPAR